MTTDIKTKLSIICDYFKLIIIKKLYTYKTPTEQTGAGALLFANNSTALQTVINQFMFRSLTVTVMAT